MPSQGTLTVILQAASPGIHPGPYDVEIAQVGGSSTPTTKTSILGSPVSVKLATGKYKMVVSRLGSKEAEWLDSVAINSETIARIQIGKPLARGYRKLFIETRDRANEFESFLDRLSSNEVVRQNFLNDPDQTLVDEGVLSAGEHLSRSNRLFISLLINPNILDLIRKGPANLIVPIDYIKTNSERLKNFAKKSLPKGIHLSVERINGIVTQQYYYKEVLKATLSDPVIEKLYGNTIQPADFDRYYDLLGRISTAHGIGDLEIAVEIGVEGWSTVSGEGDLTGIFFVIASQEVDTKLLTGVGPSLAIVVDAAIFVDSAIVTKTYIFTDTKVLCSLRPYQNYEPGISDNYAYFDDFTAKPEMAHMFDLQHYQVNEIYNIAQIADAVVHGMDYLDYGHILNTAQEYYVP